MESEQAINNADLFLREVPNVKISSNTPIFKKDSVKEQLHFIQLNEAIQDQILDTLKYIHGEDFKLKEASDYQDVRSNLGKKYWIGQGNLIVKGGYDYSQSKDAPVEEFDRLKEFALLRIESYGFHKNHCLEALIHCDGVVEETIFLLYQKYFNLPTNSRHDLTEADLNELRQDEKSSLESIYEKQFNQKLSNVWILTLKLDYLINEFHKKEIPKGKPKNKQKEMCRYFQRGENCRFGNKCKFSHESEQPNNDPNEHLKEFVFELEIRFRPDTTYPYEPPMIFLKTDAVLPPLINLHICKRLLNEAKLLAEDGIPSVYSIAELLQNEQEIMEWLKEEISFPSHKKKLFEDDKNCTKVKRPSHYKRGATNKDSKNELDWNRITQDDQRILEAHFRKLEDARYQKMLRSRETLPAWTLRKEIIDTIEKSQVSVISGETGCGKSTQVPQFILDNWIANFASDKKHIEIVCTQPRRISAIGVAERVADERAEKIGNTVGYQIRLESKVSNLTRLTFCTTGILLRRLESEPTLSRVTHIIVDEVHERSEESDFLLLILKELTFKRPDLKVILMSATMNAELFSEYFQQIPILEIPGRTFPVEQLFLEDILEQTNYVLEDGSEYARKLNKNFDELELNNTDLSFLNCMPKDNVKDENLTLKQVMARYENYSFLTRKNIFLTDIDKINNELIESILSWITEGDHNYPREGTILIFLPGIAEITALFDQLSVHPDFGKRNNKYLLLPLHSSLTSEEQAMIFKKVKQRKIILSTNLAETSVTIDDCVFVIDSGKMKEKRFDPNRNMESLETVWVTRANALQRKGRAGRVMSGVCIHLYTSHRFKHNMLPQPIPEIHRIPLEQLILNVKVLPNFDEREVGQVLGSFIEPPVPENIETALKRLRDVGALDLEENLTPLGHHLALLPVDVRIGKLMLYGAIFSCVDSALTMAACLSFKNPFVSPFGKREQANEKKRKFAVGNSDHLTVLVAYEKWLAMNKKSLSAGRNFANENFLSYKTLVTIADIKHQFLEFLVDIGFVSADLTGRKRTGQDLVLQITGEEFNKNGGNFKVLSTILCAALYPNVVKILTPAKSYTMSAAGAVPKENEAKDLKFATSQEMVFMHPSSINYTVKNFTSPYMVYQEKVKTSRVYFRDCTMVPVIPLVLFSGYDVIVAVRNGDTFISLDNDWIIFQVEDHKVAEMLKMMKNELFNLLEEKIKDPLLNLLHHDVGEKVVDTILNLINL